jgi:hypothetical protein
LISNHFGDPVGGPEKAGVGGSIPSLATTISSKEQSGKSKALFALCPLAEEIDVLIG